MYKGINFAPFCRRGTLNSGEAKESLDLMIEKTGADFVIFAPNGLQETAHSEEICYTSEGTCSDEELADMIRYAKSKGMTVGVKPTVNCRNGSWRAYVSFFEEDVVCEPKWGVVLTRSSVIFLFYILTMPVAVFLVVVFKGKIKDYNRSFRREMEETSAKVMEMVEMVPVVRAHALEKQETKKMGVQLDQIAKKGLKLDMVQTYFSSISWVAFQVFQVLCLAFTTWMAYRKVIGIGDITLYQSYFTSIVAQISNLIALLPIISKGLESVDSVGDIICANDIEDSRGKKKLEYVRGEITFSHLTFSYPKNERPVLNDLNLTVHQGETVAFVGASGSGKTTLINLAIGFMKPDSGHIFIDGCDIEKINLQSYRRHIAVVPQQSVIFTGTLRENITYGLKDFPEEKLQEVIRAANLEDVVAKLPQGLDTVLTEHGENLSGGQRQRISIARAFARDPRILILDEATSALDSVSEKKIQESIRRLIKGRTTLIVAHRLSTIRDADKIAVIGEGGLLEYGTWQELMDKKGVFYRMRCLQA